MGHETEHWSVYRRYLEFYVLESKLTEFHGKVSAYSCSSLYKTSACFHMPYELLNKWPLRFQEDTWITASNWTFVSAPLHHSGTHNLVLRVVFFSLCSLCRLISRCTVAFKENHRPQELRVPHIEARRVPGVPSGREDGTPQSPFLIIRPVPVVGHNDALSETSAC